MPISNITCITPEPNDNHDSFGSSIAINNKYLAIGDYLANQVVIYTRDNFGQWSRSKIVLPPKDSISDREGYGFGDGLQLDEDFLIISTSGGENNKKERFLINLESETEVKPIGLEIEKNAGLVTFNLFSEGKIRQITLSDRGEESFGASFAHHENLLLVGSPSYTEERGAWLYDLDRLDTEPEKLAIPNIYIGTTVALNKQFAVVGDYDYQPVTFRDFGEVSNRPKSTLIRSLKTGLTTTVHTRGKLSISGSILAFANPYSNVFTDEGYLQLQRISHLQINRITKHPNSRFISIRGYVAKAFVQNGFLITAYDNYELGRHEIHIQEII